MTSGPTSTPNPTPTPITSTGARTTTRTLLGLLAVAVIFFTLISLIWMSWSATAPMRQPRATPVEPLSDKDIAAKRSAFTEQLASAGRTLEHRSPFAPPRPVEPPKPKVPAKYAGPALVGVAGGQVFFADGARIAVGQTKGAVEVVSLDAPWSVRLRWSGGEYDVPLLERRPVNFNQTPAPRDTLFKLNPAPTTPEPTPTTPPPAQ
ncbi:MAG: hypothetical protein ACK54T_07750 [bacterium]